MKILFGLGIGLLFVDANLNADAKVLFAWLIVAVSGSVTIGLVMAAWTHRHARLARGLRNPNTS